MIKYLGLDWGEKRLGLALADSENKIATPFKTVGRLAELLEIIETEEVSEIIIGRPRKMSGAQPDNPRFLKFVEVLRDRLETDRIKISFIDERLSSVQADSIVSDRKQNDRDSLAAMIILQSFLDQSYD